MRTISALILALFLTCNIATAQDTLYIYKSGSVITKHATADIDSIIFYNSPQGAVSDIDGNIYHTVTIGTQVWMVENLKTTKYRNGDPIPNITEGTDWVNLKIGAYCNYNNDEINSTTYGRLYNWYAVSDSRNIAPTGWHIPTMDEWTILTNYLGGISVAGGKLKEIGTTHWESPNTVATNETGFTALPGGYRYYLVGPFKLIGSAGYWWSSTEINKDEIWTRYIIDDSNEFAGWSSNKNYGHSVRCVKD
jgi:uncharacterized protein (TIGR02145 family)